MALKGFWEISFTAVPGDVVMVVFCGDGDVSVRRIRSTLRRTFVNSVFWVGKVFPDDEVLMRLSEYRHYAGIWNPHFPPNDRFAENYALITEPVDVYGLKRLGWRLRMSKDSWERTGRPLGVEVVGDTFTPEIRTEEGITYRRFWF